jgi:hypothetical protein
MTKAELFAKRSFLWAAVYGIAGLLPLYFLEERIGIMFPPAITHPEHFYGFVGFALAWQVAFVLIAREPMRLRPLMPVAALEKALFGGAALGLLAAGRVAPALAGAAVVDLLLAALFLVAFAKLGAQAREAAGATKT